MRRSILGRPAAVSFLLFISSTGAAAQTLTPTPTPDPWIGKRVITQHGTVLMVGKQVVDDEGRGKQLARGKDSQTFRVYKIEHVNGPWLWLVAEGSGVKGWAPAVNVIPFDQAIDYITNLIRANPGASSYYLWRANVWKRRKELDIAIADCNEAIRLDPGEATAYNSRAWLWATCPDAKHRDGKRAVESATRACELNGWKEAWYISTLAAAYAEAGDFDAAVKQQERAITLLTDSAAKADFGTRLELYKAKKPYREDLAR